MNRSLVILTVGSLLTACTITVNTNDSPTGATEVSLMQADRDFAVATHTRGIDGWMFFDRWLVIMDTGYPEPAVTR